MLVVEKKEIVVEVTGLGIKVEVEKGKIEVELVGWGL